MDILLFWSLNCNINGPDCQYLSVDVTFYSYFVTIKSQSMVPSVVKNDAHFTNIHRKTPVPECLFYWNCRPHAQGFPETLAQRFSCEFCKILREHFFHFLWQMPVSFPVMQNVCCALEQPTVLLARRHLNTMPLILSTEILTIETSSRAFSKKQSIS